MWPVLYDEGVDTVGECHDVGPSLASASDLALLCLAGGMPACMEAMDGDAAGAGTASICALLIDHTGITRVGTAGAAALA